VEKVEAWPGLSQILFLVFLLPLRWSACFLIYRDSSPVLVFFKNILMAKLRTVATAKNSSAKVTKDFFRKRTPESPYFEEKKV
jgi:hypothetical protein